MILQRDTLRVWLLILACMAIPASLAQQISQFEELSEVDLTYMELQRALVKDLAALNLGRQFSGNRDRDLDLLQTLLDKRLVRPEQTAELQAMGIIMGDLLAAEHGLHWVVFKDGAGRSRALRYRETEFVLFPVTMISRRREVGDTTAILEIYRKAGRFVNASTPGLPFQ